MTNVEGLPANVLELIRSGSFTQYSTISAAGMPIDTPVLYFPSEGLHSLDLATGLSYPAKAERARRNPKVGLLIEGGPDEPVISIAGMAAVRDSDLQANVLRYLSEAAHTLPHNPDWSLARKAVWYWTRILIEITPARIMWWNRPAEMHQPPHKWQAPRGTVYPRSDPAPPGKASTPAKWEEKPWKDLAEQALERKAPCHLSVIDDEGFPCPIRVSSIKATRSGFSLSFPLGIPWALAGKACLTFGGIETFLGEIATIDGQLLMEVERTLPVFPMTKDMTQLWEPTPDTRAQLMRRLAEETTRRGQPIPAIPEDRPPPSEGYRRRLERLKRAAESAD